MHKSQYSSFIRKKALELGFLHCGFSKAGYLVEEAPRLEKWLKDGNHGKMEYMENHFDKRLNPRLLDQNVQSVISLAYNYYTQKKQADPTAPKISKYAFGEDYHQVIKDKLNLLCDSIRENMGDVYTRVFVDSAPILERAWAKKSGLGWVGKNANLIRKGTGSFFFLAEILINIDLDPDGPVKDYCGTCTKCIEACPTEAITEPYIIDSRKCISYLTIELKGNLPDPLKGKIDNWAFGCDVCQDVCPWNRFSISHLEERFEPKRELMELNRNDWMNLTEDEYKILFKKSALKRAGYNQLKRNIDFL